MPAPSGPVRIALANALDSGRCQVPSLSEQEWDALWVRARTHCLTPYLHHRWEECGCLGALPPKMEARFREARELNKKRNRRILEELARILERLRRAGIPALVLKGLPVAQEWYGDPGLRVLFDLDLLVGKADRAGAEVALKQLGYERYFIGSPDSDRASLLWRPKQYSFDAERIFDPERPVFVELHLRPWESGWHGFRLDSQLEMWHSARAVEMAGVAVPAPSEENLLVQLSVHYAFNVLESNARLMHLLDVGLFLRARVEALDWNSILQAVRNDRVSPFAYLTLSLVGRICHVPIPAFFLKALAEETPAAVRRWIDDRGEDAVFAMDMHERDRDLIYFLHWAMPSGWLERAGVLWYSTRVPMREGLPAFASRMLQRLKTLVQRGTERR